MSKDFDGQRIDRNLVRRWVARYEEAKRTNHELSAKEALEEIRNILPLIQSSNPDEYNEFKHYLELTTK